MAEHRNLNEKLFELVVKKAVIDKTDAECEAIYEKYKDQQNRTILKVISSSMEKLIRSSIKRKSVMDTGFVMWLLYLLQLSP